MKKVEWCCRTKNGFALVEPNPGLCAAYLLKAESSLETARLAKSKDWKVSAAYYAMYFSLYSVLQRLGVKCEIHACTILFANEFLCDDLSDKELTLLSDAFDARQDMQYYVDRMVEDETYDRIMGGTPAFISHCRAIGSRLDERRTNELRKKLDRYLKN